MSAVAGSTPFAWRHPEWWALALAAGAWGVMLVNDGHHSHTYGAALYGWMVMTVAMMLPMVVEPMRLTAERSFWHRRHRATLGFVIGYLAVWLLAGIALSFFRVPHGMQDRAAAIALVLAAAWQLTRWKQRGLNGCHRSMPLAPRGWRADRDCVRYGLFIGTRCLISCWALMLVCYASGHQFLLTLLVTAVVFAERYSERSRRLSRPLLLLGVVIFVTTLNF